MWKVLKINIVLITLLVLYQGEINAQSVHEPANDIAFYYSLYQKGELNQLEYYQLKREYLLDTYDFSKLQLLRGMPEKSKRMVIAGAVLAPFGTGLILGGVGKRNKEVFGGPDGAYEQRQLMNDRVGIGFMVAGAVIATTGVVIIINGVRQANQAKSKGVTLKLEIIGATGARLKVRF